MIENDCVLEYGNLINLIRKNLSRLKISNEECLENAVVTLFSKMVLTSCEIYTLLINGYPEGALALCRNLYEIMLVIEYLINNNSAELIDRFYASGKTAEILLQMERCTFIKNHSSDKKEVSLVSKQIDDLEKELNRIKNKYPKHFKRGNSFWWIEKDMHLGCLQDNSSFSAKHMYKECCYKLHVGLYNVLNYLDKSETGLLIGSCTDGINYVLRFALLVMLVVIQYIEKVKIGEWNYEITLIESLIATSKDKI